MKRAILIGALWVACFMSLSLVSIAVEAKPQNKPTLLSKAVQSKFLIGTQNHISSVFVSPSQTIQTVANRKT